MVPKGIAFIWAILFICVALAGGFALGMHQVVGVLKAPVAGTNYELVIVAKSGKGIDAKYYAFGKYYSNIGDLEKGLDGKKAIFENGAFRILESQENKK
jgi:hypothetical protein